MPERDPLRSQGDFVIDVEAGDGGPWAFKSYRTQTPYTVTGSGDFVVRTGEVERLRIKNDGTTSGLLTNLNWFNVKDATYGAKGSGSGSSDDTAAIQAAINAAQASQFGGVVYLPPGVYMISAPLTITADNVVLMGAGPGTPKGGVGNNPVVGGTIIRPKTTFSGSNILTVGQASPTRVLQSVWIKQLSLDGFNLPGTTNGISFSVFQGGIDTVDIARVTGKGIVVAGNGSYNYPNDAYNNVFDKIMIDSAGGDGFTFNAPDTSDNQVSNMIVQGCAGVGIQNLSPGNQFTNVHVDGLGNSVVTTTGIRTICRSTVFANLRLAATLQHGIQIVPGVSADNGGNISIAGLTARDIGQQTDNTYDVVNVAPTVTARGGVISGVSVFSSVANRPRYGVNVANSSAVGLAIGPVVGDFASPATSAFGTGPLSDSGVATKSTPSFVIAKSNVGASHTGDLLETALATITIPGGTIGPNGHLRITSTWSRNGAGTSTATARARLGGIGGTTFLNNSLTTAQLGASSETQIANRNAQNSQIGGIASGNLGSGSSAPVTSAVDTSADTTLVLTGQLATAADTITLESYVVEVMPG